MGNVINLVLISFSSGKKLKPIIGTRMQDATGISNCVTGARENIGIVRTFYGWPHSL